LTVSVIAIRGNRVRLGIEAPRELAVHREEVLQRDLADAQFVRADDTDVAELATPRPR
jgi:carbon storage regulator